MPSQIFAHEKAWRRGRWNWLLQGFEMGAAAVASARNQSAGVESSGPLDRSAQLEALREPILADNPQPNVRLTRNRRCEPQAAYRALSERGLDRVSRSNRRSAAFPSHLELRELMYRLWLPIGFANGRSPNCEILEESACVSSSSSWHGGDAERSVNDFYKVTFFAKNETFGVRCGEIVARLGIGLQLLFVGFVRRKAVESDQSPGHVVRALIRQEVTNQMTTAPGDNVAPVRCVLFKGFSLVRIDFVSD